MKQIICGSALVFFILVCATINGQEYDENQAAGTAKLIDPAPMVAPSKNEKAMTSYTLETRLLEANKLDEAETYLKEAIDLDPLFVDAMDHLGLVYRKQNRLDEAEQMYLKSIELNSENNILYQNLAIVYRRQNKLNEALEMYKKLMELDSNNPEAYYGIGELFYIVGDYEKSMPFFDKAIELYMSQNSSLIYDAFFIRE
jgi:tetratricopeptide (TPR) repeat protein